MMPRTLGSPIKLLAPRLHVAPGAINVTNTRLPRELASVLLDGLFEDNPRPFGVVRVNKLAERPAHQLTWRITEDLLSRWARISDDAVRLDHENDVDCILDQRRKLLLALAYLMTFGGVPKDQCAARDGEVDDAERFEGLGSDQPGCDHRRGYHSQYQ